MRSGRIVVTPATAIVFAVVILFIIGLLCIYATEFLQTDRPTNTIKQLIFAVAGVGVVLFVRKLGYLWFARNGYIIFVCGVLLLIPLVMARFVSFGDLIPNRRGAYRWINLPGFQLQPSEAMKIAYIVGLACYLRYRENYRTFSGLMVPIVASFIPLVLILLEPDLGTVLLMMPVLAIMLYAAGARPRHFTVLALVAITTAPILFFQLQPYQRLRIFGVALQSTALRSKLINEPDKFAFLGTKRQAMEWEVGAGMQLVRSKVALGSGGMFGQGWGNGTYVEFDLLPDEHNDFIFAIIGHQWGLIGCLVVLACYLIIILAGMEMAARTHDPFARLLAVGVIALMATQVTINVGMTIGLMPVTGMTLPFVSYGGSSLLTNCAAIGLLLSVGGRRPYMLSKQPFEFEESIGRDVPVRPIPSYRKNL